MDCEHKLKVLEQEIESLKAKGVGAKISYASQNAPNEIREGDRKIIVQTITNMDYWNYIP